jgi:hypothetical protein
MNTLVEGGAFIYTLMMVSSTECPIREAALLSYSEQVVSEYPFIEKIYYTIDPIFFKQTGIEEARIWLHHCLQNHPLCGSPNTYVSLPTRLVAVGSPTRNPYLHITKPDERSSYLALSYCWGEGESLKTTNDTLDKLRTGFVLESLPKTCQDALVVARKLGVQYIWIDRLCIIQDNTADWVQESASMHLVYAHALLTLAALSSRGGDEGLYTYNRADPFRTPNAVSEVELSSGRKGTVAAKRDGGESTLGFIHWADPASLESRLWTLQEVALSRRVLWFASGELAWSCKEATACECEPQPASTYRDKLPSHVISNLAPDSQHGTEEWLPIWYNYIEEAVQRRVKVKTDRLPAVAGMASAMKHHFGGSYFAGHWEIDIEKSLLWKIRNEKDFRYKDTARLPPMDQYYAPSWSWASVSRPLSHITALSDDIVDGNMDCRVIGMDFRPKTSNVDGPGLGILTMEAAVLNVKAPKTLGRDFEHQTDGKRFKLIFAMTDCGLDPRGDQKPIQDRNLYLAVHVRWPNHDPSEEPVALWGLVLEIVDRDEYMEWEAQFQQCIPPETTKAGTGLSSQTLRDSMVIHTDGVEGNVFRRVGFLNSFIGMRGFTWKELMEEYQRQIHII